MDFSWTPQQERVRQQYSEFATTHLRPKVLDLAAQNKFNLPAWQALCREGFWRCLLPASLGGSGEDWWGFAAALEGIAGESCDSGFVLTMISQAGFIHGLLRQGTREQQERVIPRLLDGALTATAIAEPHTGTATGWVKTIATPDPAGGYRLSGEKANIAHADTAAYAMVVGRVPQLGKRDITLFLVDSALAGWESGAPQQKHGNRTLPTTWAKMDGVAVGETDILGKPGDGMRALATIVSIDRVFYGLATAHLAKPLLREAWRFVQGRESFGQPLASHQHVQRKLTDVAIHCEQTRWVAYAALWQVTNRDPQAMLTSSVAKLIGTEGFEKSCRDLVALMGSRGYLAGLPTQVLADSLGFLWVGGTEEMHRINLYNQMARWHGATAPPKLPGDSLS